MAIEVVMPKLGATMEEGEIVKWLVDIGESFDKGDPIAEVLTDKITLEIEAPEDGVLLEKVYEEGDVVKVQDVVAYIGTAQDEVTTETMVHETVEVTQEEYEEVEPEENSDASDAEEDSETRGSKVRRTPAARKIAQDNEVSLEDVIGTGPQGRVKSADVQHYMKANNITPVAPLHVNQSSDALMPAIINSDANQMTTEKRVPFTGIRKVIADRLAHSANTVPHVTITTEIDATEMVALRTTLLPVIEKQVGLRLSYNEILMKAVAATLRMHNNINVSLEGDEIVYHSNIHIGYAVGLPSGLVVPVIKDVNAKGLAQLTEESKNLAKRAKSGNLTSEQMSGGTFTISNLGMYAVDSFTPIINEPEAAILGIGRIVEKPVGVNGEIKLRSMMTLSLSFDHRIIDGQPAAAFMTDLKDQLENPIQLLV